MVGQTSSVVVFDPDSASAKQTVIRLGYLEICTDVVIDEAELRAICEERGKLVAIFIASDANHEILTATFRLIGELGLKCACFLIESDEINTTPPSTLKARLQGIISSRLGYKELLGAFSEAEEYARSRAGAQRKDPSQRGCNLVGCSRDIQYIRELIGQVGDTDASVLITGESGTGKEVVARLLHTSSNRHKSPFVPINCGAIPLELLESELFGHEKGAFTGAISSRQGRFEMAEGGTLFLDEIGDMPMNMQVKLLRVLQERSFERVGGNKSINTNVRIVAATHRNLEQLVKDGSFRMDLFYRLNVFPIEISALRDRVEDIPLLVESFINKLRSEGRDSPRLSDSALACLARYYWPGNVREVFNLIERLAILYPHRVVEWSDLPDKFRPNHDWLAEQLEESAQQMLAPRSSGAQSTFLPCDGIDLKPHLADIECTLMAQALEQSGWVVARAAKLLNLQRTTLVEKMRKFDLNRPEEMTVF